MATTEPPPCHAVTSNHSARRAAFSGFTRTVATTLRLGPGCTVRSETVAVGGCLGVGICRP